MSAHRELISKRESVSEIDDGIDVRERSALLYALCERLYGTHELVGIHSERLEGVSAGLDVRQLAHVVSRMRGGESGGLVVEHLRYGGVFRAVVKACRDDDADAVVGQLFKYVLGDDKLFHRGASLRAYQ